jgi:prolipoprotein diacylglyceryltransferase
MLTQTTYTNGILVALATMALVLTIDPYENQKNKILYFIMLIVGGIVIGAIFMFTTSELPS